MIATQQATSLADLESEVARLERARTDALTDYGQALYHADGETMLTARRRLEDLSRRRATLLPARVHARMAVAERDRDQAAGTLADVQQTALASQQDVLDARSLLASLNSLDSSGRWAAAQRLASYEATARAAEEEVTAARRRYAAAHTWMHDLSDQARRLDVATQSIMSTGPLAARAAVVEQEEHRTANSLRSAATLHQVAASHADACAEGLHLAERLTTAMRDKLVDHRRKAAGLNVLSPERHRLEGDLPALERGIEEAEEQEGVAQRRLAAASRQLRDAKADQGALVERHAQRLPLFVRALDDLLDAGMGIERALSLADEAVR